MSLSDEGTLVNKKLESSEDKVEPEETQQAVLSLCWIHNVFFDLTTTIWVPGIQPICADDVMC